MCHAHTFRPSSKSLSDPPIVPWCAYRDGIVIPGLATVRLPDAEAQCRIRTGDRRTRWCREFAAATRMSTKRFNRLPAIDKAKIRWAFLMMTAPGNCGREPDPIDWQAFEAGFGRE